MSTFTVELIGKKDAKVKADSFKVISVGPVYEFSDAKGLLVASFPLSQVRSVSKEGAIE